MDTRSVAVLQCGVVSWRGGWGGLASCGGWGVVPLGSRGVQAGGVTDFLPDDDDFSKAAPLVGGGQEIYAPACVVSVARKLFDLETFW